jgi:hypothetical protein
LTAAEQETLKTIDASESAIARAQTAGIKDFEDANEALFENRGQNRQSRLERIATLNARIKALDPTDSGEADELRDLEAERDRLTGQLEEPSTGNLLEILKPAMSEHQKSLGRALAPGKREDETALRLLTAGSGAGERSVDDLGGVDGDEEGEAPSGR